MITGLNALNSDYLGQLRFQVQTSKNKKSVLDLKSMRRTPSVSHDCVLIQLDIFVMVKLREPVNFSECFVTINVYVAWPQ